MVSHARLMELYGASPAINIARHTNQPTMCLNSVDGEWVLTWTTGGKETVTVKDADGLTVEPMWEETLKFAGRGPEHRRNFESSGATKFTPETPIAYDGLSFRDFSEIDVELEKKTQIYLLWDRVATTKSFTFERPHLGERERTLDGPDADFGTFPPFPGPPSL